MKPIIASLIFIVLAGPAAAEDRPEWVSGTAANYPKAVYLVGVGEGPSQEKAADKARAELAKAFSLSVQAMSRASASETSNGSASSFSQEVSDDVRTSTAKVLDGVEIAQYWRGPESHFALAVLNREHSLKILRDKLEEFDKEFAELSFSLNRTEGKFGRLRVALRLVRLAKDRRRINADVRILSPEGKGVPAPASYSEVTAKARKAVAAVAIQVEATGDKAERLTSRIIDGLSAYGFKAVEKSEKPADILVEAKAEASNLPPENLLWYWGKGTILVKMSYGATGETFTRFEESVHESARDPGSAYEATLMHLADNAAVHVSKVVTSNELADE